MGKKIFIVTDKGMEQIEELTTDLLMKIDIGKDDSFTAYPILKTVDDLTNEEMAGIYPYCNRFEISNLWRYGAYKLTFESMLRLLGVDAGAAYVKKSPTGFLSIFDSLPCKRWSEVFKDV